MPSVNVRDKLAWCGVCTQVRTTAQGATNQQRPGPTSALTTHTATAPVSSPFAPLAQRPPSIASTPTTPTGASPLIPTVSDTRSSPAATRSALEPGQSSALSNVRGILKPSSLPVMSGSNPGTPQLVTAGASDGAVGAKGGRKTNVRIQLPEPSERPSPVRQSNQRTGGVTPGTDRTSPQGTPVYRAAVTAVKLGQFQFKGSDESIPMANMLLDSYANRHFPADAPKGKGKRVQEASGTLAVAPLCELPNIGRRYYWFWRSQHQDAVSTTPRGASAVRNWAANLAGLTSRNSRTSRATTVSAQSAAAADSSFFGTPPWNATNSTQSSSRVTLSGVMSRSKHLLLGVMQGGQPRPIAGMRGPPSVGPGSLASTGAGDVPNSSLGGTPSTANVAGSPNARALFRERAMSLNVTAQERAGGSVGDGESDRPSVSRSSAREPAGRPPKPGGSPSKVNGVELV